MEIASARDLLRWWFETPLHTDVRETDVTVGVTVVALVRGDPRRITLIISNSGAAAIAISLKNDVTATTGIIIAAGATLELTWGDHGALPTAAFFAISAGAGNGVHLLEQLLTGEEAGT